MRESSVRGPAVDLSEFERRMRGGEGPKAAPKADPLSELARLMQGETPESDPFSQILPDPRAARAAAAPSPTRAPPPPPVRASPPPPPPIPAPGSEPDWGAALRGSFESAPRVAPEPRIAPEPRLSPEPRFAPEPRLSPEPRVYPESRNAPPADSYYADHDDGYGEQAYEEADYAEPAYAGQKQEGGGHHGGAEGGWTEDAQYLDYGDEEYLDYGAEEEPDTDSRGGLRRYLRPWHAVAAIAVIAVGSIAWGFLHRNGAGGSKDIAVINAPEGPVKVKPTAEVDEGAPSSGGAAVLDRKDPTPVKQVVTHQEQAVDPTVAPKVVKLGAGPVDAPHEPPLGTQPRKVKTVTVRPNGARVDDDAPPPAAKASNAADSAPLSSATPRTEAKPATTSQAAKPKATPRVAAAEPAAEADAAAAAAMTSGGYAVQFGAANTEDEARALLKTVAAKYGVKPTFKPAKVGDKTVYRVRVAGVSKDSANAICNKVKASGGSCFVAGN